MTLFLIALVAFGVGLSIGTCGVAGFLLPIFFLGFCGFTASESLFLSFGCFLISGTLGAWNYKKRGELPAKATLPLGFSSLCGSVIGALIGQFFVTSHVKTVLYCVVLVSGIMIFVQEFLGRKKNTVEKIPCNGILITTGLFTAVICALSGAGGPVLVMPLLVVLGMSVRSAVGTALFDSVFIAVPALVIYGSEGFSTQILLPMAAAFLAHAAGIWIGSRIAGRVPQKPLKWGIGAFSILFSLWMLIKS